MLKIVYGVRGTGKSRRMCSGANQKLQDGRGTVVFIDKDTDHMYDLDREVRFINAPEYGIVGADMLMGFVAGIAARDFDLDALFINSFVKLTAAPVGESRRIIAFLDELSQKTGAEIMLAVNGGDQPCPDFMQKYLV